jgi:hypothetical protein
MATSPNPADRYPKAVPTSVNPSVSQPYGTVNKSAGSNDKGQSFQPQFSQHPEYMMHRTDWERLEICDNDRLRQKCHRVVTTPPGLWDNAIGNHELVKKATAGLPADIAEGSGATALVKRYMYGGKVTGLTSKTLNGLASVATVQAPIIELPDELKYLLEDADGNGLTLVQTYNQTIRENLAYGRALLLVDIVNKNDKDRFVILLVRATSAFDWGRSTSSKSKTALEYVVIETYELNPDFDPVNAYAAPRYIKVQSYHHLNNGVYTVTKYRSIDGKYLEPETIVPQYMGKTLNFIPAVFVGAVDNSPDVDPSPVKPIVEAEIGIFQSYCRLEHALAGSAEPFLHGSGMDPEEIPSYVGAGSFIATPVIGSKLEFVQPDGEVFKIIIEQIEGHFQTAQESGASLLGARKNTSESGEALRLRQANITAPLKIIVHNVGQALSLLLQIIDFWRLSTSVEFTGDSEEVRFEPNRDFATFSLTANEIIALLQSWQGRAISHTTYLDNMRRSGFLQPGETVEDEIERMKREGELFVPVECDVANNNGKPSVNSPDPTPKLDVGEELPTTTLDKKVKT